MKRFLTFLLLGFSLVYAECTQQVREANVGFKAYKTYAKVGVGGVFDSVGIHEHSTLQDLELTIKTQSVNTNNPGRDATLVKSFFLVQNVQEIQAKVVNVEKQSIVVTLSMNGISKKIPLQYHINGNTLKATGVIDLADYEMLPSLQAINKACYDLHSGKTWQDVTISLEATLKQKCTK